MQSKIFLSILFIMVLFNSLTAQEDIQIGGERNLRQSQSGFFDFSDPEGINIKVQIWGYVKYPGYYVVPAKHSINDLISLAGGPTQDALMEDIRIMRMNADSSVTLSKYNYNSLLWEENIEESVYFPRLTAGDMILVPGEPRYFARQDVSFYLSVLTALASTTALIISITK
ncbi:MAG: SLBB domain-containing protein [Ignavibacteriaceae bacterium]|nr:SLBB domain-containing protein [Ignavibacteriaceae bacterium]